MSSGFVAECSEVNLSHLKSGSGLRIAFIHNKYISYRLPFFEKMARLFEIKFFFDQIDKKTRIQTCMFSYIVLKSIQILDSSVYDLTWSPMLLYHLLKGKFNFFIGSGVGQFGTYVTFMMAVLLRKPFMLWNEGWHYSQTFLRSLRRSFLNILMKKSTAFVVPGLKAKAFLIRNGVSPEKIFIAHNASSLPISENIKIDTKRLRELLGINGKPVVLYLGRLVRRKGIDILIKAFSKLQKEIGNSVLVVAGDGEELKNLQNLCLDLKVRNVIFVGYIDEKDKSIYYSIADVFVLPSVTHSGEVWDLVINEAMMMGKPVISTKAAGASQDMVKNGLNGYIVNDGDAEALSKAIIKLLKNPERMRKMGLESKRIVDSSFSFDNMVEGFIKAIRYATN